MRIAHLDTGRTWRGGQGQVLLLMRELRARGHEQRAARAREVRCSSGPSARASTPCAGPRTASSTCSRWRARFGALRAFSPRRRTPAQRTRARARRLARARCGTCRRGGFAPRGLRVRSESVQPAQVRADRGPLLLHQPGREGGDARLGRRRIAARAGTERHRPGRGPRRGGRGRAGPSHACSHCRRTPRSSARWLRWRRTRTTRCCSRRRPRSCAARPLAHFVWLGEGECRPALERRRARARPRVARAPRRLPARGARAHAAVRPVRALQLPRGTVHVAARCAGAGRADRGDGRRGRARGGRRTA